MPFSSLLVLPSVLGWYTYSSNLCLCHYMTFSLHLCVFTWPSSLSFLFSSYEDIGHVGFRAHPTPV